MVRRLAALTAALTLAVAGAAYAAPVWKQDTQGQRMLKAYVERADDYLLEFGEQAVNSLFEMYGGFAVFGITAQEDAEVPEEVEVTCRMSSEAPEILQVRVSRAERFPAVAAAFLRALNPTQTPAEALKEPQAKARQALEKADQSFEQKVDELNGSSARVYYAYFPNQYRDGVNWIQMTIVFPLPDYWDEAGIENVKTETRRPNVPADADPEYEGYASEDDYSHLDVFSTETPEPDSAAKEYDPVWK